MKARLTRLWKVFVKFCELQIAESHSVKCAWQRAKTIVNNKEQQR